MTNTLPKLRRRAAAFAAIVAAVLLTSACGSEPAPAPATAPAPAVSSSIPATPAPVADAASIALSERFHADNASAPWHDKVTLVELDGAAVIVMSTLTKKDKTTTVAICEAAHESAKASKVDFYSVTVRSAEDRALAYQNDKYGPEKCQN
ncbi:hypothetical protein [Amycolatopsis sp. NPDC059657]|uniref:hypothetical protein n=1 Tax=Amycolatopsis sp. NPDC059657 TaxID=3346899 RepID=UPI003670885A